MSEAIIRNLVIEWGTADDERNRYRVLWRDRTTLIWIDVDKVKAWPEDVPISMMEEALATETARIIPDPWGHVSNRPKTKKQVAVRDRAYHAIRVLVKDEPAIYWSKGRGTRIHGAAQEAGTSPSTVIRWIRRFWQRGCVLDALLPDYHRAGGGLGAIHRAGKHKRGAPSSGGINVNDDVRRLIDLSLARWYRKKGGLSLVATYVRMCWVYFHVRVEVRDGIPLKLPDYGAIPTYNQFYYWAKKANAAETQKKRRGMAFYNKHNRPLAGTAYQEVLGPGTEFEIDATQANFYVVSAKDRSLVLGRPVVYHVADVFSHLYTGIYIGLEEGPSWVGMGRALLVTLDDKAAWCLRYGVVLEPGEWPAHHWPRVLSGDRAPGIGRGGRQQTVGPARA